MCMDVTEVLLDGKASGVAYKVMRPGLRDSELISPIRSVTWIFGVSQEASLAQGMRGNVNSFFSTNSGAFITLPQGIYMLEEAPVMRYKNRISEINGEEYVIAKFAWSGLLARGIDGRRGFSTLLPLFTVMEATMLSLF